jgi:hypothetical protein
MEGADSLDDLLRETNDLFHSGVGIAGGPGRERDSIDILQKDIEAGLILSGDRFHQVGVLGAEPDPFLHGKALKVGGVIGEIWGRGLHDHAAATFLIAHDIELRAGRGIEQFLDVEAIQNHAGVQIRGDGEGRDAAMGIGLGFLGESVEVEKKERAIVLGLIRDRAGVEFFRGIRELWGRDKGDFEVLARDEVVNAVGAEEEGVAGLERERVVVESGVEAEPECSGEVISALCVMVGVISGDLFQESAPEEVETRVPDVENMGCAGFDDG